MNELFKLMDESIKQLDAIREKLHNHDEDIISPIVECKGKNCEALYGVGHSKECIAEHDAADHLGAGNRHPEARYRGSKLEPLQKGASRDEKYAWIEGYHSRGK